MRTLTAALAAGLLWLPPADAVAQQVIPQPVKLTSRAGQFTLTPATVIWTDPPSAALGHQLARYLEPATGFTLRVQSRGSVPGRAIVLRRDRGLQRLGPEGYRLDVRPAGVVVRAPEAAGLFYALQTIRQLLPPEIFREAPVSGVRWTAGVTQWQRGEDLEACLERADHDLYRRKRETGRRGKPGRRVARADEVELHREALVEPPGDDRRMQARLACRRRTGHRLLSRWKNSGHGQSAR